MTEPRNVAASWEQRIADRMTPDGSVVVPPRVAAYLEAKAGVTADRRILLRGHDDEAYEVLMALHFAADAHRSGNGTEHVVGQRKQPKLMTTTEAAKAIGVTDRCIRKRIATGRLPAERHGGSWLINPAQLNIAARLTA
jgi:excisionase family DNA binding protein